MFSLRMFSRCFFHDFYYVFLLPATLSAFFCLLFYSISLVMTMEGPLTKCAFSIIKISILYITVLV